MDKQLSKKQIKLLNGVEYKQADDELKKYVDRFGELEKQKQAIQDKIIQNRYRYNAKKRKERNKRLYAFGAEFERFFVNILGEHRFDFEDEKELANWLTDRMLGSTKLRDEALEFLKNKKNQRER